MEKKMSGNLYIAKSKTRQDLLALFFTNPSNKYYLRELERLLGYAASTIRRELLKFQKDGLLKTEKTGNLLYYYLNASHPLFKELKNIVFKTVGVEGSLKQMVSSVKGIKTAFIYGSFQKPGTGRQRYRPHAHRQSGYVRFERENRRFGEKTQKGNKPDCLFGRRVQREEKIRSRFFD